MGIISFKLYIPINSIIEKANADLLENTIYHIWFIEITITLMFINFCLVLIIGKYFWSVVVSFLSFPLKKSIICEMNIYDWYVTSRKQDGWRCHCIWQMRVRIIHKQCIWQDHMDFRIYQDLYLIWKEKT